MGQITPATRGPLGLVAMSRAPHPAQLQTSESGKLPTPESSQNRNDGLLGAHELLERPHQPRIFLGGGQADPAALRHFWRFAGGSQSRIVAIGWGSSISDQYYEKFCTALSGAVGDLAESLGQERTSLKVTVQKMPDLVDLRGDFERAVSILQDATGVFFLGGDQVCLMNALKSTGIGEIIRHILESDRIVLAGTSAGTAVGSRTMIGGYGMPPEEPGFQTFATLLHTLVKTDGQIEEHPFFVGEGLGIVPDNVVLEQHLLRDGRVERLMHAVEHIPHIEWGIGIDDSMGLVWNSNNLITAVGPTRVLVVRKIADGSVREVTSLRNGEVFDLSGTSLE